MTNIIILIKLMGAIVEERGIAAAILFYIELTMQVSVRMKVFLDKYRIVKL
ncbi:hypothetical protein [Neobacillus niacini]|uniref:hypothetical protein n=1 Tax=Neobacillus niacini TaxID=86668 RepID=UPI001C8D578F|nr:hypothetical protein [Neobacillus niacini]MBY0149253.1 hypothetical protein [Neobacillus niacini]